MQSACANVLLAKSVFQMYLTEHHLNLPDKDSFTPKETHMWKESMYQKVKTVANCLFRDDLYKTDHELAMFLDISMMECVQGKNKLHEIGHCMLCLKHCNKLIQSHIMPRSILEKFRRAVGKYKGNRIFQVSTDPMKYFTDKTLTRNLLCESCEALLNISGEQNFYEDFFEEIYDASDSDCLSLAQTLQYGEWLYHFFIGFIFRGIAAFIGIPNVVNHKEVYELFSICRKFLLKQDLLPSEALPDFHMFINPTSPPSEYKSQWNYTTLVGPGNFHAACSCLSDEDASHCPTIHYIFAKIGVINVVVKLSPAMGVELPNSSLISPSGGTFKVPSDEERVFLLPQGIKNLYTLISQEHREIFQDSIFRKDSQAPMSETLKKDIDAQYRSSFGLSSAMDIDKLEFQQRIEKEGALSLKCLPPQFILDQKAGEVHFPPPFMNLLHYHTALPEHNFAITVFIGVKNMPNGRAEPFVVYHESVPKQVLYFGYTFNLKDCAVNEYISELPLQDYPEPIADRIQQLSKDFMPHFIPIAIEKCGFLCMESLMYHYEYK